jgi:glycine/D-amino acid oxidase-like deaminating enzyme/nitrite reductase/ring-hydroxylating ferredoxin subunit
MYDSQRTSGESLPVWYQNEDLSTEPSPFPDSSASERALERLKASEVDVIVVGAGITGLSVAYHLLEAGRSVVVLDKGEVGCGETGRSTAHVSNALDDHYSVLERVHGAAGAKLAAASHSAAIESIASIVARERIDCDFARVEGYLFAAHGREHELLQRELSAARRAGIEAELVNGAPLPFATGAAVRFPNQAQFQPLAYVRGLADAIRRRGGQVVTGIRVLKFDEGTPVRVHCEGGGTLSGRALVIATNTPIIDRFAMHTKQAAYRSYAIGVAVAKGSVERALYWDTEDPYHYVRLAGDDDMLIVGGEDHKCGQSKQPEQSWDRLEQWTRARFPQASATRFRWSGQVWEPVDHLAFIGRNPGRADNVFIATGDSGNGITHGALAGILLTDLIVERENPWARLYDPSRMVTQASAAKEFLKENLNVALSYGGYLGGMSHNDHEVKLEPGQGAVARRGVRRVAVYMDEQGQRHECSAVCTHLGGPLQWNSAERSWDCPCHGARFDPYGKVITGPAVKNLEPIEPERQSATSLEPAAE